MTPTPANPADEQGTRPVPDPTVLTTEALQREIAALKELLETVTNGNVALFEERLNSVTNQLALIESRRVEQKSDTKLAVDAALNAAKEAVQEQTIASERSINKSENATAEQLKQLGATFTTAIDGLRREVSDIKDRVTSVEQRRAGGHEAFTGIYAFVGGMAALIGAIGIVVAVLVK